MILDCQFFDVGAWIAALVRLSVSRGKDKMISAIAENRVEISIPFKKTEASIGASGSRASGTLYTYTNHPRTVRKAARGTNANTTHIEAVAIVALYRKE